MRYSKSFILFPLSFILSSLLFAQGVWVETTQKDFADGVFEHTIYASHREYKDSLPGAIEFVQRFDYNNDGWMDVVVSNVGPYSGGPYREAVFVYLQYPGGGFLNGGEYERLSYPTGAAGDVLGADLNADGYPELIIQNFWYYPFQEGYNRGGVSIFWGDSLTGYPDPSHWDSIGPHEGSGICGGVYVADLNKDGYLDIISGIYPKYRDFSIFWGSKNGYSEEEITTISISQEYAHPTHNFEVADFDKDGYYDILVTGFVPWSDSLDRTRPTWLIYWGGSTGYSEDNFIKFSVDDIQGHGATVADLNNDGWLDLVCTTYRSGYRSSPNFPDKDTGRAVVYYGLGDRKFSKDSTVLRPGYCFGGSAAADLYPRDNPDGWLDLVFFVGNIDGSMHEEPYKIQLWLYYGGPDGFSDSRREPLDGEKRLWSSSGGLIADFNVDGYQDIFINDWVTLDGHSGVLYGPDFEKIEELPNHTDHHGTSWEVGNTYDRGYYEEYISSVYDAEEIVNWDKFSAFFFCPEGARISLAFRRGNTFKPDDGWSDWYVPKHIVDSEDCIMGTLPDNFKSKYIQYKVTLHYKNPACFPILYEMRVEYGPAKGVEELKSLRVYREKLTVKPSIIERTAIIEYTIPERDKIVLGIYDAMGRLVLILDKGCKEPGEYKVFWGINNKNLASGVYFVRLKGDRISLNKRLVRLRRIKERRR